MKTKVILLLSISLLYFSCSSTRKGISAKICVVKVDSCESICNKLQFVFKNNSDTDYYMNAVRMHYQVFKDGVDVTKKFNDNEFNYYQNHTYFYLDSIEKRATIMDGRFEEKNDPDTYPYGRSSAYYKLRQDVAQEETNLLLKLNNIDSLPYLLELRPDYISSNIIFVPKGKTARYEWLIDSLLKTKGVYKITFDYQERAADTIETEASSDPQERTYKVFSDPRKVLLNKYHRYDGRLRADTLTIEVR